MSEPAPALEARSVAKHFPVHQTGRAMLRRGAVVHAVDGVSLTVPDADILAIVGESGCGKSTLARLLARVLTPTSGEVLMHGVPATAGSRRAYARTVQMVLQDPFASLNPAHTVAYHVGRPLALYGTAETCQGTPRSSSSWTGWHSPRPRSSRPSSRMSCPAASGSGWRSPAPWRRGPRS